MAAPLLKINDIVDQYCLASGDHDRKNYLAYQVFAKLVMRDLHLNLMPNPKRVFLRVNKKNNTVQIPMDFYKEGSVAIVDDCNQIIPLSFNEYINTVVDTLDADCKKENQCCDCKGQSEICDEVSTFETVTETVEVPTPVSTLYDYSLTFPVNSFAFAVTAYVLNGETITETTVFHNQTELDDFFDSIGWTKINNTTYTVLQASDVWGCFSFEGGAFGGDGGDLCPSVSCPTQTFEDVEYTNTTNIKTCENGDIIKESCIWTQVVSPLACCQYQVQFNIDDLDFTITQYRKNNTNTDVSVVISDVTDMELFMSTLGFSFLLGIDPDSGLHYVRFFINTSDVWNSLTYSVSDEETTVGFLNHGCTTSNTIAVEQRCTTQTLCNVPVKPCGCIIPTPETEQLLAVSCGCLLQSCCKMFCPTPTPQVANGYGSCKIDIDRNLIFIESPSIVEKVVLSYFTDGRVNGVMYIPEFCLDAVMRGIKYRESMVNRRFQNVARQDKLDYQQAQAELHDYNYPMRIDEVRRALKLFYQN